MANENEKTDRQVLEELYSACLGITKHLGNRSAYFSSVGAPDTSNFVDAVLATKKYLGDERKVFYQFGQR